MIRVALGGLAVLGGCADNGDDDRVAALEEEVADLRDQVEDETTTTTSVPPTTATTTAPTSAAPLITAPPPPEQDTDLAVTTFVFLVNEHCDLSMVPDPNLATATVGGEGRFLIVDLDSVALVLDIHQRIVYSTDGPDGVLPRNYSFGCDPSVFVGTVDH
jgi:hypothetical protein